MSLRQILLVLKREYITRIKSKAFILTTIFLPLAFIAYIGIIVAISVWHTKTEHAVAIKDNTEVLYPRLHALDAQRYRDFSDVSEDSLRNMVINENVDGYIILANSNIDSTTNAELIYSGKGGIQFLASIRSDVRDAIREERLKRAHVSAEVRQIYTGKAGLDTHKLTKEGVETQDDTGFRTGIGIFMGVIIFMILLGYGGLLTRSVIEEKTNRIIEVIASSVKPIELLIGKMAGVASLALTQIAIWIAAGAALLLAGVPIAASYLNNPAVSADTANQVAGFQIPSVEASLIIYFIIFFILGFMIYSSLFAAIGSAVDSQTDTQQFMFPVMIPIMISYFLLFQIIQAPDTSLAVITSLIPFFSPILMVSRIAITDVPFWQIALSIILMIATFLGTIWLSAKIYSVGILSYGKSATFKELGKWIRQG